MRHYEVFISEARVQVSEAIFQEMQAAFEKFYRIPLPEAVIQRALKPTIYGIKSATWRFLFKIRDIPTKTKGKKSDPWRRFFYRVKKATIVPLFLPFRFFYRVSAFFTCTFLE